MQRERTFAVDLLTMHGKSRNDFKPPLTIRPEDSHITYAVEQLLSSPELTGYNMQLFGPWFWS